MARHCFLYILILALVFFFAAGAGKYAGRLLYRWQYDAPKVHDHY